MGFLDRFILRRVERGIFVVDKKSGITSHDEVFKLRGILKNTFKEYGKKIKTGHSGTLDPKVTGVLVLGSGKGTKVLEYILLSKKEYIAEFIFHAKVEENLFRKSLQSFLGKITQLPPVKSAVKREEREREVYDLEILNFSDDGRYARVFCSVERGTYIRKLAHDLGEFMSVVTSMGDLKRTRAGVFSQDNSKITSTKNLGDIFYNFSECKRCWVKKIFYLFYLLVYIYPIEELFLRLKKEGKMKQVFVKKESVKYILSGNPPRAKNICINKKRKKENFKKYEIVSIFYKPSWSFFGNGRVLAVGEFLDDFYLESENKFSEKEVMKLKKVF